MPNRTNSPAQASLDAALNSLEVILERRKAASQTTSPPSASTKTPSESGPSKTPGFNIPLLDDVVVPGQERRDPVDRDSASPPHPPTLSPTPASKPPAPTPRGDARSVRVTGMGGVRSDVGGELRGEVDTRNVDMSDERAALNRRIAQRLANEVEVIVQARLETAVSEAAQDIRAQVQEHLQIIIPEIIDELLP